MSNDAATSNFRLIQKVKFASFDCSGIKLKTAIPVREFIVFNIAWTLVNLISIIVSIKKTYPLF